jgi:hypothetical protein
MKSLIALCICVLLGVGNIVEAQNKYALIIAVGSYPEEGGWKSLASANDVPLVKNALLHHAFPEENIAILLNEKATKSGIMEALEILYEKAGPRDIVVIHYSGHGQQITDDNGDEIDGYDEALVPYDAQKGFKIGVYEGENHIRDDDFGLYLEKLQLKLGSDGNILVIIDACHSGTATRSEGTTTYRGTFETFDIPSLTPTKKQPDTRGGGGMFDQKRGASGMASLVVMSGARHDQLNSETRDDSGNPVGSLSYAFGKHALSMAPNANYKTLFDKIKLELAVKAPNQSPQIEGDVDKALFAGYAVPQKTYFSVINVLDPEMVLINTGKMAGMHEGSKVAAYPIGKSPEDGEEPLVTGIITKAEELRAEVTLDWDMDEKELWNAWYFVTDQSFGKLSVSVDIQVENSTIKQGLTKSFAQKGIITTTGAAPELLINTSVGNSNIVQLVTSTDASVGGSLHNAAQQSDYDYISEVVMMYAKAKYLREMEYYNADLDLQLEIIPVTYKVVDGKYVIDEELDIEKYTDEGGQISFPVGTTFTFKVTNNGRKKAYFNVIHINPLDTISVFLPFKKQSADELVLNPRASYTFPRPFIISSPVGQDMFKVIASNTPIDLRPLVTPSTRDLPKNPFEELFANTVRTRDTPNVGTVPPSSFSTHSVVFKVFEP